MVLSIWVVLVVLALATQRITGLITSDDITAPIRKRFLFRGRGGPKRTGLLADLIECQWCVSMYVAFGVVVTAVRFHGHPWLFYAAVVLAFSQVTGMLSQQGRK